MKRFSFEAGEFVKNEVEVGFDIGNLSMAQFVHEQAPKQLSANYSLYAVTVLLLLLLLQLYKQLAYYHILQNHDGRLNSGHYTSFIRNLQSGEWMKFDDDQSSRTSPSSIITKRAFILYYTNTSVAGKLAPSDLPKTVY